MRETVEISRPKLEHIVRLDFINSDAQEGRSLDIDIGNVPSVMAWYGAFHSGDNYRVTLDGQSVPIDLNGEPLSLPLELKGDYYD